MIPRRFFWLFDLLILVGAFLAAYALIPWVKPFFAPGGRLWISVLDVHTLPATNDELPPITEFLWILLAMAPTTILILELLKGHSSLLDQSYTRTVVVGLLAPFAGLSLITLA